MSSTTQPTFVGPLANPDRDFMTDRHVTTVGDALRKTQEEANEHYRRAGSPNGFLDAPAVLSWWCDSEDDR